MRATTSFEVTVEGKQDIEVLKIALQDALYDALPETILFDVTYRGTKEYSEQGGKVARKRIFGVSVAQAGDGATKTKKLEEVT
jgi:hypothetical protein